MDIIKSSSDKVVGGGGGGGVDYRLLQSVVCAALCLGLAYTSKGVRES